MTSVNSSSMTSSASSSSPTSTAVSSALECTPEVMEEKKKTRCKRTATLVCLGVLVIALLSLTAGVTLHFLLETAERPMQATEFVDWAKTTNPASRDPGLINDVAPISTTHMFPYLDFTKKSFTTVPASDADGPTSWVNISGPTTPSTSTSPTLTSSDILSTARSASTDFSEFHNNTKFTDLHTTRDPVFSLTNESKADDSPLLSSSLSSTADVIMPTIVTKTKSSTMEAVTSLHPSELPADDSMTSSQTTSADGAQSLNQPASSGGTEPTSLMIESSTESTSMIIESFTDSTPLMTEPSIESTSLMIESSTVSTSMIIESSIESTSLMIEPSTESSLGFSDPAPQPPSASTDSTEPTPLLNSPHRDSFLSSLSFSAVITPISDTAPSTLGAMTLPQPSGLFVDDLATSFYQTASVTTGGVESTPVPITPSTSDVESTPSTDSSLSLLIQTTGDTEPVTHLSTSSIHGAESTPVSSTGGADISSKPRTQSTGGKDSTSLPEISSSSSVSATVWLENSRNLTTATSSEYFTEGFSNTTLALSELNRISSSNSLYASNNSVITTESVTVADNVIITGHVTVTESETATERVAGSVTPLMSAPVAPAAEYPNTASNTTQSSPIRDLLSLKNMELDREASMVNSGASSVPGSSNSLLGKHELLDESDSSQRKDVVLDHEDTSSSKTTSDGRETFLSKTENNTTTTTSSLIKETVSSSSSGLSSSAIKAHPSTGSTSTVTVPSTVGSLLSTIFSRNTNKSNSSSLSSTTPMNKNFNNFEKEPDSSLQSLVSPLADVNPDGNFVQEDNLTAVYNETFTHAPLPVFNATQDKLKSIMSSWTGGNSSFTETYNETYPRGTKPSLKSESTNNTKSDERFSVFMDLIQDQENITRDFHNFTEMAINDLVNSLHARNTSTNTTTTHSQAHNHMDVGADSTGSHNSYLPIEGLSHGNHETANTPKTNTSAHVEVVTMTPAPVGLIHLAGALNPFIGWSHDKPNRTGDERNDDNKSSTSYLPPLPSRSRNSSGSREEDQRNIAGFSKDLNPHSSWSGFSSLSGATDINSDHRFFTTTAKLMTSQSLKDLGTVARERSSGDPNSAGFVSLGPNMATGSSLPAQTTTSGGEVKHDTRNWSQMAVKTKTETTTSTTVLGPKTTTTITGTSTTQPSTLPSTLPPPNTGHPTTTTSTTPASVTSTSAGLVLSMLTLRTTTAKVDLPILEEPLLDPLGFPISSDNTHTTDHAGDDGSNLFAFPRRNRNSAHKPATPSITTTTTKRPTTTTTEKPAEVIIIAPDVTADLGMSPTNSLKVTCHAFQAWGWTYMSLSRFEGTGNATDAVEFLGGVYIFDEFPFIPIDSRMSHHRVHRDTDRVTLTLESQYAVCEDKGTYLCEIIVNGSTWSKTFNVDIRKKPDMPKLKVPGDLISGEEATFVTTWNAGYPLMGTIVHEITKGYTNLPKHATKEQTTTRVMKCEIIVTNSYTVIPDVTWNATEIQVSILPRRDATPKMLQTLEVLDKQTVTLSVLRSDICVGNTNMILPHPYTCTKFINCNDGIVKVQTCPEKTCFHRLQLTCY
ncbi:uncharacterized protein LOC112555456 isoform X3 [Pomacea canaliculata]|nr:uncharacterized protein LOC112555456 isoform X3 [Pomacea canaliculata]